MIWLLEILSEEQVARYVNLHNPSDAQTHDGCQGKLLVRCLTPGIGFFHGGRCLLKLSRIGFKFSIVGGLSLPAYRVDEFNLTPVIVPANSSRTVTFRQIFIKIIVNLVCFI